MERRLLQPGLEVSRLIYGMWRVGDDKDTSAKHVQAKIESCLEQGITTIDQADIYGGYTAEAVLGTCLKAAPHLRDKIEIVTKCGIVAPAGRYADRRAKYYDTSRAHILASVEHSLLDMNISQIDVLLVHRPDPFMDHTETGATLDEVVKSGKVRAVGVSNFKLHDWTLLQSAMQTPLVTNQIEASVICHQPFTNGGIAYLQERGVAPMAWSPLAGGALFSQENTGVLKALAAVGDAQGYDETAVAIAWLLAHPAGILPVLGTNNLSRIAKISDASKVEIDRQAWFEIYTAAVGKDVP
jgi:predicted oxidoreductase